MQLRHKGVTWREREWIEFRRETNTKQETRDKLLVLLLRVTAVWIGLHWKSGCCSMTGLCTVLLFQNICIIFFSNSYIIDDTIYKTKNSLLKIYLCVSFSFSCEKIRNSKYRFHIPSARTKGHHGHLREMCNWRGEFVSWIMNICPRENAKIHVFSLQL